LDPLDRRSRLRTLGGSKLGLARAPPKRDASVHLLRSLSSLFSFQRTDAAPRPSLVGYPRGEITVYHAEGVCQPPKRRSLVVAKNRWSQPSTGPDDPPGSQPRHPRPPCSNRIGHPLIPARLPSTRGHLDSRSAVARGGRPRRAESTTGSPLGAFPPRAAAVAPHRAARRARRRLSKTSSGAVAGAFRPFVAPVGECRQADLPCQPPPSRGLSPFSPRHPNGRSRNWSAGRRMGGEGPRWEL
jgi:hypothetical protein